MKDIETVAKNIKQDINGQTYLSYKREKRGSHRGYRWLWSFSVRNIETGYYFGATGSTPEKAFNRFVKQFYEKGGSEKYFSGMGCGTEPVTGPEKNQVIAL